jgi:hypothetical protein
MQCIAMQLDMYIMEPEPTSTAYFINPSHESAFVYVFPVFARQRLLKRSRSNEYTNDSRRNVGRVVFYAVRLLSWAST